MKSAVVADSAVRPELRTAGFAETPAKGRPRPKYTLPGYALTSLTRVDSATSPKCLRPRVYSRTCTIIVDSTNSPSNRTFADATASSNAGRNMN